MTQHPSVNVCPMCGLLVGNQDLHDAWHVAYHEHDRDILAALDEACGAMDHLCTVQDIDGERLAALENG